MVKKRTKMLLHTCCAPCAIFVVQQLVEEYEVTIFFYNPNIQPDQEYQKRKDEIVNWATAKKIKIIEGDYELLEWQEAIKGWEAEVEGGKRCQICFELRLGKTADWAQKNNFEIFTTTMSISPHKNAQLLNGIGEKMSKKYNIKYLVADWKKKDGFKKAVALSKEANFYRQDYCGCLYSLAESKKRRLSKKNYEVI